jgi:hypothetical protein
MGREMDEVYARLSNAGGVLCGRPSADGRFHCDQPLAEVVRVSTGTGAPERRLAALDGWAQDKRGVWQRTTRAEDRRRHGIATPRPQREQRTMIEFPALVRCPKCRLVQWLDAERLRIASPDDRTRGRSSRWVVRQ